LFEKINKIDMPLAKLIKRKIYIQKEREKTPKLLSYGQKRRKGDTTKIQGTIKNYFEN
jgi:hypothetical protein